MILKEHDNMIVNFLMKQASKPSHQAEYLENYIRSCAGYCVITFVLGIGDRHLDNILIRENGQLFHIDFGFIFGKDPKPLPPKVRLITEMIDAMGGFASSHYYQFLNYCFSAYSVLRKNANLFLNLVSLMCDSGIPDLQNDFDGAMMRFQERFRLDLEDEEANEYLLQVMLESMNAFSPKLMEEIHKVMTRLR
jgi:phosphatidylinositol 3-kinase